MLIIKYPTAEGFGATRPADSTRLPGEDETVWLQRIIDAGGWPAGSVVADDSVIPNTATHPRTVFAIYTDIGLLTAVQQNAIWTDLSTGSPPRWALDAGPNAAAIAAIHWSAANSGASAAAVADAKRRLSAMYAQDNPKYLVNPAFSPLVNISGTEIYTP